jgi:hypothetical protein
MKTSSDEGVLAELAIVKAWNAEEEYEAEHAAAIHGNVMVRSPACASPFLFSSFFVQKRLANGELDGQLEESASAELAIERAPRGEDCEAEHVAAIHDNAMVRFHVRSPPLAIPSCIW